MSGMQGNGWFDGDKEMEKALKEYEWGKYDKI
jgi:hypothetical protein